VTYQNYVRFYKEFEWAESWQDKLISRRAWQSMVLLRQLQEEEAGKKDFPHFTKKRSRSVEYKTSGYRAI